MDYLAQFGYYWFWFGLSMVLLVVEAVHGRFLFLPASVAAVVVGILSNFYPYVAFPIQILFFVVASGSFIWMTRSFLNERAAKMQQQQKILEQRSYVGQTLTLVSPIENGRATQDLNGMVWTLRGQDSPAGTQVKVVDMGEGWLKVEPD